VGDSADASPIRVSIGLESAPDEALHVSFVFRSAGIDARIEPDIARPSLDVPWVLHLSVRPIWLAARFSETLDAHYARDTWPGLMRFVHRISRCFHGRRGGVVVLTDPGSGVEMALTEDLPGEAYKQLIRLPFAQLSANRIGWNFDRETWCDLSGEPVIS
jgi:hypothetical protein